MTQDQPVDVRPTVSIQQAADRLGVSRRTVYNWLRLGKLEAKRIGNGRTQRVLLESMPRRAA